MSGGIFISYRRQDTGHLAGRLYDRLAERFGRAHVFMDVDTIEPGAEFAEVIGHAIGACEVLVAIIGQHWLTVTDKHGRRRLDAPDDLVRLEVEAALARAVRVIPILVDGAVMPREQDLPESLSALSGRNALTVRHESFRRDADQLVSTIERVIGRSTPTAGQGSFAPFQLPLDIGDFTGREDTLALVRGWLEREPGATAVPLVAVSGKPGVGKTALAVHVAHQLRPRFPDAQLYVDLRGTEATPLDPAVVLGEFLRALGVAARAVPEGLDERARMYRARLAERRALVLLDNAAGEAQVRPLLPGGVGCAVLMTSRTPLAGLEAARRVNVEVLAPKAAVELLARVVGPERTAAEPATAERIAEQCGYLPLALRIAGARLVDIAEWRLGHLAELLADANRRLGELVAGDREVRASFALSYRSQPNDKKRGFHRRGFRRLGLLAGPDFAAWVAAPLLEVDAPAAERVVRGLAAAQLLEVVGEDATGQLRYRFHDLLRLFARERLKLEEPEPVRRLARERVLQAYRQLAELANSMLFSPVTDANAAPRSREGGGQAAPRDDLDAPATLVEHPFSWFSVERASLVAAVQQAHKAELWELTYRLAAALTDFFEARSHWSDWEHTHELGLSAARAAGDRHAQAWMVHDLGTVYRERGDWATAQDRLQEALPLFAEAGDRRGEASTLRRLGVLYRFQGEWDDARANLERALPLFREAGDERGEANTLRDLGILYHYQGRLDDAERCLHDSLNLLRGIGDRTSEAHTLRSLGDVYVDLPRLDAAVTALENAERIARDIGDQLSEAHTLRSLGRAYSAQGRLDEAVACFHKCLPMLERVGDRRREALAWQSLGDVYLQHRRFNDARACYQRCLPIFQAIGDHRRQAQTLHHLGDASAGLGDQANAIPAWQGALELLEKHHASEADEVRAHLTTPPQRTR